MLYWTRKIHTQKHLQEPFLEFVKEEVPNSHYYNTTEAIYKIKSEIFKDPSYFTLTGTKKLVLDKY